MKNALKTLLAVLLLPTLFLAAAQTARLLYGTLGNAQMFACFAGGGNSDKAPAPAPDTSAAEPSVDTPPPMDAEDAVISDVEHTCTLSVRCDTLLDRQESLLVHIVEHAYDELIHHATGALEYINMPAGNRIEAA